MNVGCLEPGCDRTGAARGLCIRHYNRHRLDGSLPPLPTDWERYMQRVTVDEHGCWAWSGKKQVSGHALFHVGGRIVPAYRWAYEQKHGPVDPILVMDHFVCHRGSSGCANPQHVRPEDRAVNAADSTWSRKTHCPQGHPYDEENTTWEVGPHGRRTHRRCRSCLREQGKRWYANRGKAQRQQRKANQ